MLNQLRTKEVYSTSNILSQPAKHNKQQLLGLNTIDNYKNFIIG